MVHTNFATGIVVADKVRHSLSASDAALKLASSGSNASLRSSGTLGTQPDVMREGRGPGVSETGSLNLR